MKATRITALLTALSLLLLCLAGCSGSNSVTGSKDDTPAVSDNKSDNDKASSNSDKNDDTVSPLSLDYGDGDYFSDDIWHADVDFTDLEYIHYDISTLDEYTAPIYAIAENGGTADEFSEADSALYAELYYIYTLYSIVNIKSYKDASDTEASEENLYMQDLYYDANNEYWSAMHAVAVSPYSDVMTDSYPTTIISWFADYEPSDDSGKELYSTENRLVQQYYTMIAEDDPDYDAICDLYVELVNVRNQIATQAGYDSYAEYAYDSTYAKDYTPEDSEAVWNGAKEYLSPIMKKYGSDILDKSDELYYSTEFKCSPDYILSAMDTVLSKISPELYEAFKYMLKYDLYDIEPSYKKSNIGFTTMLYYYNEPYIFNSATNSYADYTDMFHEFGHFANYYYTNSELLFGVSDNDLSELQSQGMEIIFSFFYNDLFGEDTGKVMRDDLLLNMIFSIVDGAMYDEFQQRVYSEPELTSEKVRSIFDEVYRSYGYSTYDGYENEWIGISHNFENPFYYISYAVSAVGALEIYQLCCEDMVAGVDKYLSVEALDSEVYYYSEAIDEAGLSDIFDISTYSDIADALSADFS